MLESIFRAGGDIRPSRFVKPSVAADFTVLECDANENVLGVSMAGTNRAPIPEVTTDLAAVAGESLLLYGEGESCLLELGGTVVRGARLKADADGKGVAIATTGTTIQQIGAVALQSGNSGEKIKVLVTSFRSERPALT